jgi:spore coat polysaccharide biosynthesis protein SpsF (cytidylyltransferase family)
MNTAIFLTTRYGSKRYPGKHLTQINGIPETGILLERIKRCKIPIIMVTPDTLEDKLFMKPVAERHGIGFFSGEVENIIKRHADCAEKYGVDWVINVDGDDTLTCPEVINAVYHAINRNEHKIPIKTEGLPLGLNILAYPAEYLNKIDFSGSTGWGAQVTKNAYYAIKFNYDYNYRATLDYSEDLSVITDILTNCKRNITIGGICSYLKKNPEIAKLNLWRNEEYWKRIGELGK